MEAAKPQDSSSSKRHFHWTNKVGSQDDHDAPPPPTALPRSSSSSSAAAAKDKATPNPPRPRTNKLAPQAAVAVARLRSAVLTAFGRNRLSGPGLGHRVVGTLFGSRRGHVHFALQREASSAPAFLIELATPIGGLVKEMASGLVRIALECDKPKEKEKEREKRPRRLLEESAWRTYCNGKKCGFATRRECGARDWSILRAVEPISMGAGVLPSGEGEEEEVMYMRAKFERIVGSRDSEAFYMMNPDSNGAPELSIYLLRV